MSRLASESPKREALRDLFLRMDELYSELKKRAEEQSELMEYERRNHEVYSKIVEGSTECIYVLDLLTRKIVASNAPFQRLIGYTAEELRNKTIYDVVDHPHDDIDARLAKIVREGSWTYADRRYRKADSSVEILNIGAAFETIDSRSVIITYARKLQSGTAN